MNISNHTQTTACQQKHCKNAHQSSPLLELLTSSEMAKKVPWAARRFCSHEIWDKKRLVVQKLARKQLLGARASSSSSHLGISGRARLMQDQINHLHAHTCPGQRSKPRMCLPLNAVFLAESRLLFPAALLTWLHMSPPVFQGTPRCCNSSK